MGDRKVPRGLRREQQGGKSQGGSLTEGGERVCVCV